MELKFEFILKNDFDYCFACQQHVREMKRVEDIVYNIRSLSLH